jgi:NADPH2:quinone reductase
MKAIRIRQFGDPEAMVIEKVEDPRPADCQVLINIRAAGVNPVEAYIRTGTYARKPVLPYTPGSDGAGVVVAVGEGVTQCKAGARVYTSGSISGTYAELALCAESQVHPLPENITFQQGAALGVPYATAFRALFQRASAKPGETVLVHGGSGGVGIACVQLAKASGMTVIATAGSEKGRNLLRQQGVDLVLDHTMARYLDRTKEMTNDHGVDIILEMRADVNLAHDLEILAPHGRIIVIGSRGTVTIDPRDLMGRDADVRGMMLFAATEAEMQSIHAALGAGLLKGTLRPVIGKEYSLKEAPKAHRALFEGGAQGKIVLVP